VRLWHVREDRLEPGTIVAPGRWGQIVLSQGQQHPFFFREQFLELFRRSHTTIAVSRLSCAYAFEDLGFATDWAKDGTQVVHEVEAADSTQSSVRLDMLWVTWQGEPGSTFESNSSRGAAYWNGQSTASVSPTANPAWEWTQLMVVASQTMISQPSVPASSGPRLRWSATLSRRSGQIWPGLEAVVVHMRDVACDGDRGTWSANRRNVTSKVALRDMTVPP
jgi:hypothetical protein